LYRFPDWHHHGFYILPLLLHNARLCSTVEGLRRLAENPLLAMAIVIGRQQRLKAGGGLKLIAHRMLRIVTRLAAPMKILFFLIQNKLFLHFNKIIYGKGSKGC
jgi:hypothetical protein